MNQPRALDSDSATRLQRRWLVVFVVAGLIWRLGRFAIPTPFFLDEVSLGINIVSRSYRELLQPLCCNQLGPIGFLWLLRWLYLTIGLGDYAARLPQLLAGTAALLLFYKWARLFVSPLAAVIGTGIAAVSVQLVMFATQIKPYASDFFIALWLSGLAGYYLKSDRVGWLIALVIAMPICIALSYPAVFVGGAVGVALLVNTMRQHWRRAGLVALFTLVLCASFAASLLLAETGQYKATAGYMVTMWRPAFPPFNPLVFPYWFVRNHISSCFAYPLSGLSGAGLVSFVLSLIGLRATWHQWSAPQRILVLGPFGVTLIAAAMRRYPYGDTSRIAQHLAPFVILLVGAGAAALIDRLAQPRHHRITLNLVGAVLVGIAAVGLVWDFRAPYLYHYDLQMRSAARDVVAATDDEPVYVLKANAGIQMELEWYLRARKQPVIYRAALLPAELQQLSRSWIIISTSKEHTVEECREDLARLAREARLEMKMWREYEIDIAARDWPPYWLLVAHLTRQPAETTAPQTD